MAEMDEVIKFEKFLDACEKGNIDEVKRFLNEDKIDVNKKNDGKMLEWGRTALMISSQCNQVDVIKVLCENGASLELRNDSGETAFLRASYANSLDAMKLLFHSYKCDINAKDSNDNTALIHASRLNYFDQVKFLVENKADLEAQIYYGVNPLMNAVESSNPEMVKLFIDRGADIYAKDNDDQTLLSAAASSGKTDVVNILIEKIDVNAKEKDGSTALSRACDAGDLDMVKYLCSKNAKLDDKTKDGKTSLMRACATDKSFELASFLLSQGESKLNINAEDENGYTALTSAVEKGEVSTVKFLIEKKAKTDVVDKNGRTLIMIASQNGNLELVQYFVENGLTVGAADNDGCTALMMACEKDYIEIVKYLHTRDASIYDRDNKGYNPLMKAAENYNVRTLRYLSSQMYCSESSDDSKGQNTGTVSKEILGRLLLTNKALTCGILCLAFLYTYYSRR